MNKLDTGLLAFLLLPVLWFSCGQAVASHPAWEYHADAAMQLENGNRVEQAYGYAYVVTDKRGHGVIRGLFSNGSSLHHALFNARIRFLDEAGRLIRVETFEDRIEAAGTDGAAERQLTKLVDLTEFADVEVDFFLSDVPAPAVIANIGNPERSANRDL